MNGFWSGARSPRTDDCQQVEDVDHIVAARRRYVGWAVAGIGARAPGANDRKKIDDVDSPIAVQVASARWADEAGGIRSAGCSDLKSLEVCHVVVAVQAVGRAADALRDCSPRVSWVSGGGRTSGGGRVATIAR